MDAILLERFKGFYQDLGQADLSQLQLLYAQDVFFRDPVHELRGLVALEDYMTVMAQGVTECRFEYLDEIHSDHSAYIKWLMHFRHPRLGQDLISVRGITHLQYDNLIHFHEDCYDMGAMLYEQLPVLGALTRWLKRRLEVSGP